ncbi:uncharacterized protein LOC116413453 [Galleria mellonella]|uniref:Uncharacterized protein LOC116413453 n=1 Tax=Galleria mellonella TaxID=7137 RepID=A0A6J3CC55_GALME|nr:uncharacterized protein LOC116413453 [Galleria mellonella]
MNYNPAAFLMTYDPGCIEEHSDSSEFDEPGKLVNSRRDCTKLHETLLKKWYKMEDNIIHRSANPGHEYNKLYRNDNDDYMWRQQHYASINDTTEINETKLKANRRNNHNDYSGNISTNNRGDQMNCKEIKQTKSKCSLMRHKLILCLSNIFTRTNNSSKHTNTENRTKNTYRDNSCQVYCTFCKHKQLRKYNKTHQSYLVQPVYIAEGCKEYDTSTVPYYKKRFFQTRIPQGTVKVTRNVHSNTSFSLTSLENERRQIIPTRGKSFKTQCNIVKEELKTQSKNYSLEENEPCSSKYGYQVLSTPENYQSTATGSDCVGSPSQSIAISNSSAFWEYVFDKISKRYHIHKTDSNKTPYDNNISSQCSQYNVQTKNATTYCCTKCDKGTSDRSCTCNTNTEQDIFDKLRDENPPEISRLSSSKDKEDIKSKTVQCKCLQKKIALKIPKDFTSSLIPPADDVNRPCQEPHDKITQELANKYNGEILCIHNPPCILINGCFNLSSHNVQTVPAWSMTQEIKPSFYKLCQRFKSLKRNSNQSAQYPLAEQRQYQIEEKTEKVTQSICNHKPPCEIVRRCYKAKYDPKLENSCIHVPMCQKIPECLLNNEKIYVRSCEHTPKCMEVPLCRNKYLILTAKDNIGTQVKPRTKMICRHVPPCIMIPKCLGRLMNESYFPYDAIPNCIHEPMCELIPACGRKPPKMVSVYSQYPAPCRIV